MHVLGEIQADFSLWPRCREIDEATYREMMSNPPNDPYEWSTRAVNRRK